MYCECKDNNRKLTDKLQNIIMPVYNNLRKIFFHSPIGGVLVATELTVAVGWIDDLPGVAMDPG